MVQAAKSVEGVRECKADYKAGTAEVTYDPATTSPEAIAQVIAKQTGYKATAPKKPRT